MYVAKIFALNIVRDKNNKRDQTFNFFFFFTKVQKVPYDKYINEMFPKK